MAELVHSIREVGLLQPVVVRPPARPGRRTRYELVMGERRWRASQTAGLTTIPAIIRETDDTAMLRDALLENLHRVAAEPAGGGGSPTSSCSRTSGAPTRSWPARIGRSRPQISNTIRLLKLGAGRPAQGRRRRAVGGPRPVAARGRGPRSAGPAGHARDRRGHQRPRPGGDRRGRRHRVAGGAPGAPAPSRPRPAWPSSPSGSRTGSRPGSRSTSAGPRAGSPSSSRASTTCAGSSTSWTRATASDRPI